MNRAFDRILAKAKSANSQLSQAAKYYQLKFFILLSIVIPIFYYEMTVNLNRLAQFNKFL